MRRTIPSHCAYRPTYRLAATVKLDYDLPHFQLRRCTRGVPPSTMRTLDMKKVDECPKEKPNLRGAKEEHAHSLLRARRTHHRPTVGPPLEALRITCTDIIALAARPRLLEFEDPKTDLAVPARAALQPRSHLFHLYTLYWIQLCPLQGTTLRSARTIRRVTEEDEWRSGD